MQASEIKPSIEWVRIPNVTANGEPKVTRPDEPTSISLAHSRSSVVAPLDTQRFMILFHLHQDSLKLDSTKHWL